MDKRVVCFLSKTFPDDILMLIYLNYMYLKSEEADSKIDFYRDIILKYPDCLGYVIKHEEFLKDKISISKIKNYINIACSRGDIKLYENVLKMEFVKLYLHLDPTNGLSFTAAKKGNLEILQFLERDGFIEECPEKAVKISVRKGHHLVYNYLKSIREKYVDSINWDLMNIACEEGNIEMVKILHKPNTYYCNAFNICCKKGHLEILKFLALNGEIVSKVCVTIALKYNHQEIYEWLMENYIGNYDFCSKDIKYCILNGIYPQKIMNNHLLQ